MAQPFIGDVRLFAGNFAPRGYALCNGQLLSIAQYAALYQLIGTTYGGDGQQTFALPNLQSRVPVHQGNLQGGSTYLLGQVAGVEGVSLNSNQIPSHTHLPNCLSGTGASGSPVNMMWAGSALGNLYLNQTPTPPMQNPAFAPSGSSQPHSNIQPYQVLNYIIALEGAFPSRN
jgi:microcystin-dependent protein